MNKRKKILILFFVLLILILLAFAVWRFVTEMNAWASYDPKEASINRMNGILDIAYTEPISESSNHIIPSCGGLFLQDSCWRMLQDEVKLNSNQYSMSIIFYNKENYFPPWRGGDEITLELLFENGTTIHVGTYESCVEWCKKQDD